MNFGKCSLDGDMITHDGTILAKAGISYEDIKAKFSFDITIELASGNSFTGTIILNMPVRKHIK